MTTAAPEPDDYGLQFADPDVLDRAIEAAEDVHEVSASEPSDPRIKRLLRSRFVEAEDVPRSLDVRDWPSAGLPVQHLLHNEHLEVPKHRLRQLRFSDGRIVYEAWTPIPKKILDGVDLQAASLGIMPVGEWKLTYHVYDPHWCDCPKATLERVGDRMVHPDCGRERQSRVEGSFDEHVKNLQFTGEDDALYNGLYPTIQGDAPVHYNPGKKGMEAHRGGQYFTNPTVDGGVLRGGHEITGGRAEHRRLTKNMTELGPGYLRDVGKIQADKAAKKKAAERLKLEQKLQLAPERPFEL